MEKAVGTREVRVGNLILGGDHPPAVQTMAKVPLTEEGRLEAAALLEDWAEWGCDLVRFSAPSREAARQLGLLAGEVSMPLVADILFDYRIALDCLDYPIAKIRINPGNIGAEWKVREVVQKAADRGVPLRIGVNAGSLPEDLAGRPDRAQAMVEAAEEELNILERLGFDQALVSLKASDIETTLAANRLFASRFDVPLHIGVTEAGPMIPAVVRSSVALTQLLQEGIGATLRVSISADPVHEIVTAREILRAAGRDVPGVTLVSCPRCGRATFDTHQFLQEAEPLLMKSRKRVKVAVMGCVVNGPGEARDADLGLTGSGRTVTFFRKGEVVRRIDRSEALDVLKEELENLE